MALIDPNKLSALNLKKRLPLIVAVVAGISAVIMVNTYLRQKEASIRPKSEPMGQVLVAKEEIPAGETLTEEVIGVQTLPMTFIQPRAAGVAERDRVLGRIVTSPIMKGEQILLTKLTLPGKEITLATRTPPGKRAVTVSVDNIASLSGMIKPGDYVDVLGIVPLPGPQGQAQLINLPLFQNVLVLAVGTRLTSQREAEATDRYKKETKEISPLITLALTAQEASLIAFVQEQGKVRLVLRSPTDTTVERIPPATFETLLQYAYPELLVRPSPPSMVEIYRGLKREEMPLAASQEEK